MLRQILRGPWSEREVVSVLQQAAGKNVSVLKVPQALKRGYILNDLAAGVELMPFPNPAQIEFFRSG